MSSFPQSVPASFRRPPQGLRLTQTSRFAASLMPGGRRAQFSDGLETRTPVSIDANGKKAFSRLPHEPEDARLTGVTRSLHRRLLALNLGGSLMQHRLNVRGSRIA